MSGKDNAKLSWTSWAEGKPDSYGLLLVGWPLSILPTALSNIHTAQEMKTLLDAIISKTCTFRKVLPSEDDQPLSRTQTSTSTSAGTVPHYCLH